jgi:hypothetical protein
MRGRYHPKIAFLSLIFLALPASSTYQLKDFGFGSGGAGDSASSNYSLEGIAGEQSNNTLSGSTYNLGSGLTYTNQANVPTAPTVVNSSNWYNKLRITINQSNNPSDTKYAIAVSPDSFVTTYYVQDDFRLGTTLGLEDYQTYATLGSGSGFLLLGLQSSTTYQVKVKAWQGKFTETGYGPSASAATVSAALTFDIDVSASDTETSTPFTASFGNLLPNTVTTSSEKVWVDFDTNAENGGTVFVSGQNSGLKSTVLNYTIAALTSNLAAASEGYGAQGVSATESSGGPFIIETAYSVSSDNVATIDTVNRGIFSATSPVTAGRGSFQMKAKASSVTPAANDYQETLTVVSSANF